MVSVVRRFDGFRQASLALKDEEIQVNTLIYTIVDAADDILTSFRLSVQDKIK